MRIFFCLPTLHNSGLFIVADPDAYFVGGGIVEAEPHFRDWCMDIVRGSTELRDEQRQIVQFAVVPDLDMAGARGSALAALQMLRIAAA